MFPSIAKLKDPLRHQFTGVVKALGIGHFRFHDLRRTSANFLAQQGATVPELMRVFGWKSVGIAMRYAEMDTESIRGIMEKGVVGAK